MTELSVGQVNQLNSYLKSHTNVSRQEAIELLFGSKMSSNSGMGLKVERSTQAPAQQTEITKQEAENISIETINNNAEQAIRLITNQDDGEISKGYNWIKEKLNSELARSNVAKVAYTQNETAELLRKSKEEGLTYDEYLKARRDTLLKIFPMDGISAEGQKLVQKSLDSLTPEQMTRLQNNILKLPKKGSKGYEAAKKIFNKSFIEESTTEVTKTVPSKYSPEQKNKLPDAKIKTRVPKPPYKPADGERLMTFDEVYKLEQDVDFDKINIQKYDKSSKEFAFFNEQRQKRDTIHNILDSKIRTVKMNSTGAVSSEVSEKSKDALTLAIYDSLSQFCGKDTDKINKTLKTMTGENFVFKKNGIKLELAASDNKSQFAVKPDLTGIAEKILNTVDNGYNKLLGSKSLDSRAKEMAEDYKAAYGEHNAENLASAFAQDQEGAVQKVRQGVEYAGTAVMIGGMMFFGPVSALAGGAIASFGGVGTELLNESTRSRVDDKRIDELKSELAQNAALMAVGMGAGKLGSTAKAALTAKNAPKLVAIAGDIGTDATVSLLGDMVLTGQVDIKGEGFSQLISLVAGHNIPKAAKHVKERIKERFFSKNEEVPNVKDDNIRTMPDGTRIKVNEDGSTSVIGKIDSKTGKLIAAEKTEGAGGAAKTKTVENTKKADNKPVVLTPEQQKQARSAATEIHNRALQVEGDIVNTMHTLGLGTAETMTHRPKSEQSIYDKIHNAMTDKKYPATLEDAIDGVRDKVGTRTEMADFDYKKDPEIMELYKKDPQKAIELAAEKQSEQYVKNIEKLILEQAKGSSPISAIKLSNYKGKNGIPYFSDAQVAHLRDVAAKNNIDLDVGSKTTKVRPSGYTALQMNFTTKSGDTFEWQLRGSKVNTFAEAEHVPYDIRQKKDVTGGKPILKNLYTPLEDIVKHLNDKDFDEYNNYLTAHYEHLRKTELGFESKPPVLPEKFDKRLNAENLEFLHSIAEDLKKGKITEKEALEEYKTHTEDVPEWAQRKTPDSGGVKFVDTVDLKDESSGIVTRKSSNPLIKEKEYVNDKKIATSKSELKKNTGKEDEYYFKQLTNGAKKSDIENISIMQNSGISIRQISIFYKKGMSREDAVLMRDILNLDTKNPYSGNGIEKIYLYKDELKKIIDNCKKYPYAKDLIQNVSKNISSSDITHGLQDLLPKLDNEYKRKFVQEILNSEEYRRSSDNPVYGIKDIAENITSEAQANGAKIIFERFNWNIQISEQNKNIVKNILNYGDKPEFDKIIDQYAQSFKNLSDLDKVFKQMSSEEKSKQLTEFLLGKNTQNIKNKLYVLDDLSFDQYGTRKLNADYDFSTIEKINKAAKANPKLSAKDAFDIAENYSSLRHSGHDVDKTFDRALKTVNNPDFEKALGRKPTIEEAGSLVYADTPEKQALLIPILKDIAAREKQVPGYHGTGELYTMASLLKMTKNKDQLKLTEHLYSKLKATPARYVDGLYKAANDKETTEIVIKIFDKYYNEEQSNITDINMMLEKYNSPEYIKLIDNLSEKNKHIMGLNCELYNYNNTKQVELANKFFSQTENKEVQNLIERADNAGKAKFLEHMLSSKNYNSEFCSRLMRKISTEKQSDFLIDVLGKKIKANDPNINYLTDFTDSNIDNIYKRKLLDNIDYIDDNIMSGLKDAAKLSDAEFKTVEARGLKNHLLNGINIKKLIDMPDELWANVNKRNLLNLKDRKFVVKDSPNSDIQNIVKQGKYLDQYDINSLAKLTDSEFEKVSKFLYIKDRAKEQFIDNDFKYLAQMSDSELARIKDIIAVPERGKYQFSGDFLADCAKLPDEKLDFVKKAAKMQSPDRFDPKTMSERFSQYDLKDIIELDDKQYKRAIELVNDNKYIEGSDLLKLAKFDDSAWENLHKRFTIETIANNGDAAVKDLEKMSSLKDDEFTRLKKLFQDPVINKQFKDNTVNYNLIYELPKLNDKTINTIKERNIFSLERTNLHGIQFLADINENAYKAIKQKVDNNQDEFSSFLKIAAKQPANTYTKEDALSFLRQIDDNLKLELKKSGCNVDEIKNNICQSLNINYDSYLTIINDKELMQMLEISYIRPTDIASLDKKYINNIKTRNILNITNNPATVNLLAKVDDRVFEYLENSYNSPAQLQNINTLSTIINNKGEVSNIPLAERIEVLNIIDGLDSDLKAGFEKSGINLKEIKEKVTTSLGEKKPVIETPKEQQLMFVRNVLANNNKTVDNVLKNFDYSEYKDGLPLKYTRAEFNKNIDNILSKLSDGDKNKILAHFNLEEGSAGFDGMPNNRPFNDATGDLKIAADKVMDEINKFTLNNEVMIKDADAKQVLDGLIKGLPEFTTIVEKPQHGTHAYTVDVHTLKVLQSAMNDPLYKTLPNADKTVLKIAALLHDTGKKGGVVDTGHAGTSANYAYSILDKFKLPQGIKDRIIDIVDNHHWFEAYNQGKITAEDVAVRCRRPEDFKIYEILSKADFENVNDTFHLSISHTSTPEEFSKFMSDKMTKVQDAMNKIYEKANIVMDTQFVRNGDMFPHQTAKIDGKDVELKVLNLSELPDDTSLLKYGFASNVTAGNARFIVHMTEPETDKMLPVKILMTNPMNQSSWSTSLISKENNRTYTNRKFGFILDTDQANISEAYYQNTGSGREKGLDTFKNILFNHTDEARTYVRDNFISAMKEKGIDLTNEDYAKISKYLLTKKYTTQIKDVKVNGKIIKAKDLVEAMDKSRDALFNGGDIHSEIVSINPRIKGLIAKVSSLDECPEEFLRFAQKEDLPIILMKPNINE